MIDTFLLSFRVTLMALVLAVPIGGALGFFLARGRGIFRTAVDVVVVIPLVLPPSVTGYYLLVAFGIQGWLGGPVNRWLGIRFVFTQWGAALAAAVVSLPLMAKGAEAAFARIHRGYEEVARANGLRPWQTFRLVTFPLAARGLAIAVALTALRALGEFGATLTFAGYAKGATSTAPLELYVARMSNDDTHASEIALILVVLSALVAMALGAWGRQKQGQS